MVQVTCPTTQRFSTFIRRANVKQTRIAAVLIICIGVIVAIGASKWNELSVWYAWQKSKPNVAVQNAVSGLKAKDISYIELKTPFFPKEIRSRATIAALLNGLKAATLPDSLMKNRVDTITLSLKTGKKRGPFYFSLDREVDSFSPEFVSGLRSAGIKVPR